MRTVALRIESNEGAAPLDMLSALFEARGWPCETESEEEILVEIQGSWTNYQLRAIWRVEDKVLQILCLPDIRVPEGKRAQMFELLALVNEQIWVGHFDIWSQGGMLLYRHGLMLGDDGLLALDHAQAVIESAIGECDRFYPAFQFALWGDKLPQDALSSALVDAAGEH
ncbi:type III secretion system chaperone family protein [Altererythrobacter sp. CAU 1778]